MAFLFFI